MIRQVVTAGVFCLLAGAAGADSVTTICTLQIGRQQTWVPTQVVFRRDRGSDIVLVNDPLILHFVKKQTVMKPGNLCSSLLHKFPDRPGFGKFSHIFNPTTIHSKISN